MKIKLLVNKIIDFYFFQAQIYRWSIYPLFSFETEFHRDNKNKKNYNDLFVHILMQTSDIISFQSLSDSISISIKCRHLITYCY